jgi:hypothetical protein
MCRLSLRQELCEADEVTLRDEKSGITLVNLEQRCFALPYSRDHIYHLTCEQSAVEKTLNEGTMVLHINGSDTLSWYREHVPVHSHRC